MDNSLFILERYPQINKNIICFPGAKGIPSHVLRKQAIESANGQYVLFLEGNDYFLENSLSELYKKIKFSSYHDIFEFRYIDLYDSQTVLIPNIRNRFFLLFDNYFHFLPTVLNGVYSCQMLKAAFQTILPLQINIPINLYEFAVIYFFSKNILVLDNVVTAIGGVSRLDIFEDQNYSVEYIKSMRMIYDSLNYFLQDIKLYNLINSLNLKNKIFYHIVQNILEKQIDSIDKSRLFSIILQYFPESLPGNCCQGAIDYGTDHLKSRKLNLKYFILDKYKSLVPNRIKRFIQKKLITCFNKI
jgi:hypothetical protein